MATSLTLTVLENDTPAATEMIETRSPLIKLPKMPKESKRRDRFYYFGFPTTFEKLHKIALQCYGPPESIPDLLHVVDPAERGIKALRKISGFRHVYLGAAVAEPGEEIYDDGWFTPYAPGEKLTPIASVFMAVKELEHRKPTAEQMAKLEAALGKPRWCRDIAPKSEFWVYDMGVDISKY